MPESGDYSKGVPVYDPDGRLWATLQVRTLERTGLTVKENAEAAEFGARAVRWKIGRIRKAKALAREDG